MSVPEPAGLEVETTVPFWRNPWLVAFIAGAITITSLRDCTRRVPDSPSPMGHVPEWTLPTASGGQPQSSAALGGRVYILAFGAKDCSSLAPADSKESAVIASCGVASESARELQEQLDKKQATATFVHVDTGRAWEESTKLSMELAKLDAREIVNPWDLGFVLVDGEGRCRGFYGLHDEGQDEVLHRSQHVARDEDKGEE